MFAAISLLNYLLKWASVILVGLSFIAFYKLVDETVSSWKMHSVPLEQDNNTQEIQIQIHVFFGIWKSDSVLIFQSQKLTKWDYIIEEMGKVDCPTWIWEIQSSKFNQYFLICILSVFEIKHTNYYHQTSFHFFFQLIFRTFPFS